MPWEHIKLSLHVLVLEETALSQHSLLSFPPIFPPFFTLAGNENYFNVLYKMCRIVVIISVLLCTSHECVMIASPDIS